MLGQHWLAEAHGCSRARLEDPELLRGLLGDLARVAGVTVVVEPVVRVQPDGVVGMVLLAESHASVHTLPEAGEAFVDLFSCSGFEPEKMEAVVREALQPERLVTRSVTRGRA